MENDSTSSIDLSRYNAPIIAHVICIFAVIVFGGTGNGFVLYIYSKKKGNVFIRCLAFLDLICVSTIAPQFAFVKDYYILKGHGNSLPLNAYFGWFSFFLIIQEMTIIFLAIDRALAICSPLTYKKHHKRLVKIYAGICVYCSHVIIMTLNFDSTDPRQMRLVDLHVGIHITLMLSALLVSYSVIIYKLRKQRTKTTESKTIQALNKEKREIKMIKIAFYINILYLLTSFPSFISTAFGGSYLMNYTLFISSCGGPLIYIIADKSFREEFVSIMNKVIKR